VGRVLGLVASDHGLSEFDSQPSTQAVPTVLLRFHHVFRTLEVDDNSGVPLNAPARMEGVDLGLSDDVNVCRRRPGDDVRKDADHWDKDDEDKPQCFGDTMVVTAPEIIDEAPDDDEDPEDQQRKLQQAPEDAQQWIRVGKEHSSPNRCDTPVGAVPPDPA